MIVGTIVGGAVLVVLLFAGPAAPERRSLEDLLQALEAGSGEKSMGLLLTREKELWQAALELSVRLEGKVNEAQLTETTLQSVAARLGTMVKVELANIDRFARDHDARAVRSRRLEFLIQALGRTERPEAVAPLLLVLDRSREPYAIAAMHQLGRLHEVPQSRQGVKAIVRILSTAVQPETQLMACTVLSVLATRDDKEVIDALTEKRLTSEGEVAWSAALALARLGSSAGKSTLLDLLDRAFLESDERYHVADAEGRIRRYPLPPQRVEELLMVAIDAASGLDDPELWAIIAGLEADPSPAVRSRAKSARKAGTG